MIMDLISCTLMLSTLIISSHQFEQQDNHTDFVNRPLNSRIASYQDIIISNKLTYLTDSVESSRLMDDSNPFMTSCMNCTEKPRRRIKRTLLNQSDKAKILSKHNALRRLEGSSNMQYLTWNSDLEDLANDWAAGCNFDHGQPSRPAGSLPYNPIGQNLYAISGVDSLDVSAATDGWYNEKSFYNYNTGRCSSSPDGCGHYTQIVWAATMQVGCAYAFCSRLSSTTFTNAFYFVCNYGPAGNYAGEKPYFKGPACSQCGNGHAWCDNGLCRADCSSGDTNCDCSLACANCGELDRTACRCMCQPGWYGNDCSNECKDLDSKCNGNPGWPPSFCNYTQYQDQIRKACPAMCGLCTFTENPVLCRSSRIFPMHHFATIIIAILLLAIFL